MTQRTLAGLIAAPLVVALLLLAWLAPLPYVVYRPGPTLDVLGDVDGEPIIEVSGHASYDDDGQLRMTTVSVTQPEARVDLFTLLGAWLSRQDAVYPYASVYDDDTTAEENESEGAVQMVSSQDTATAVALHELGYDVEPDALEVISVNPGDPADGQLKPKDRLVKVDGQPVKTPDEAVQLIRGTPAGQAVTLDIVRQGRPATIRLVPTEVDGVPRIGATLGPGYDFPFEVDVNVGPDIGGPSAGLMFSLAIYDTLTPGSLSGGETIAGTGEIAPGGEVGPIGGIQQKIAGARRDGAELFLVPADNCQDALGADRGDMRLVKVDTMHDAVEAVTAWTEDHDATLPSCGGDS